jgi:uncharacterized OsmC-like protein
MTEQNRIKIVNGVNITQLGETINAIKETPSLAEFKFRIANRWLGGGRNRTTVKASCGAGQEFLERDGRFIMEADEPPILLSQDTAASPVEYLLHALAACVTTAAVYHAAARNIPVESVESQLEGELDLHGFLGLDPSVRNGFSGIRIKLKVTGDLSEGQKHEVVELGMKFSPVYDMITNEVPISVQLAE